MVLLALEIHPPWWGHAGVWIVCGLSLLSLYWWTATSARTRVPCQFAYVEQSPGRWAIVASYDGSGPYFQFSTAIIHEQGTEWECWRMPALRVTSHNTESLKGELPTQDQLDATRHLGLLQLHAFHTGPTQPPQNKHLYGQALQAALAGRTWAWDGWFYWPRRASLPLGLALFAAGALLTTLRHWVRQEHTDRVRAALRGQCPSCGYSLTGISSGMCPECGLDVQQAMAESMDELEPRR
jgi:hypothetical protein